MLFDNNDKLSLDDKRKYFLNQIIWRLYDYTNFDSRNISDEDNPILRLKDDDKMKLEYFITKETITLEMIK